MNVVIAIDSWKGCLSSCEAGQAIRRGIRNCMDAKIHIFPLSDGGEGFVESYVSTKQGFKRYVIVHDAMMRKIKGTYTILPDTKTAVMEIADICGITRIDITKDDVLRATTYGLGEMIIDAIQEGCRHFVIGLGGSGTNDGGSGMLKALGYQLLDKEGQDIPQGALGLSKLASIHKGQVDQRLMECQFTIACDVENPLLGKKGCTAVFAPQKGADATMVNMMDAWLTSYSEKINNEFSLSDPMASGAGAAGGLGYAFQSVLRASLVSGIQMVSKNVQLKKWIADADIVVTGEGCLDEQTIMGKAPAGIALLAKKYHKPVIAFAGVLAKHSTVCNKYGIDAFFCIQQGPVSKKEAMCKVQAQKNLSKTVEQVFRLYQIAHK